MICQTCHGTRYIAKHPGCALGYMLGYVVPCPDCIGGTAHCCDGLTAANDAPADPEDGGPDA